MARDYKNAGSKRRKPSAPGFSGWVGLAIGLTLGVAMAATVHLHHVARGTADPATAAPASGAEPAETTAAESTRRRPTFDFYRMLPNYEVVIPEEDMSVTPAQATGPVSTTGTYVLQAGSFRNAADADRLRAQLALLGIESRIQTVTIDDADTWHRVRIGPMRDLAEVNTTRRRLVSNSIDALVIRVGD